MLRFLLAEQFCIGFDCRILDLRQHLTDGLNEITLETGCDQCDEINKVAPVQVVGVALEWDGFVETEVDLADFQLAHRIFL